MFLVGPWRVETGDGDHCVATGDSLAVLGQGTHTLWSPALEVEGVGATVESVVHQLTMAIANVGDLVDYLRPCS